MFSVICTAMFLSVALFYSIPESQAWNDDYAYGLPKQKRMCVKRDADQTVLFTSVYSEEDCPEGSQRYIVVFGREPKGA